MTLVKLVIIDEDKECSGCTKKILKGEKVVQQIDQEYPDLVEYYHHTKKCCEETFEDYKSITEKEQEMDEV